MVKSVGECLAIGAVTDHMRALWLQGDPPTYLTTTAVVRADGGLFLCIITLPLFAEVLQI
jgi:hypothetical protein